MASFDENGKYIKTNWKAGDKITATKLNKIEESIEAVNDNDISRHVEADARLDALEAKDVAHDKEFTNVKNLIADNKAAAELGDYEINSRMQFLEDELNEGIEEVHNVASTVDGKIAQGKADMEAMVAEVEADLEGLHAKDDELSAQLEHIVRNSSDKINYISTRHFDEVQDAVEYAKINNINTIILDSDKIINKTIELYDNMTLDLNGFKIDGSNLKESRISRVITNKYSKSYNYSLTESFFSSDYTSDQLAIYEKGNKNITIKNGTVEGFIYAEEDPKPRGVLAFENVDSLNIINVKSESSTSCHLWGIRTKNVVVDKCEFINHKSEGEGGNIWFNTSYEVGDTTEYDNFLITNCKFTAFIDENIAFLKDNGLFSNVKIKNNQFRGYKGMPISFNANDVKIEDNEFIFGGIYIKNGCSDVIIRGNKFKNVKSDTFEPDFKSQIFTVYSSNVPLMSRNIKIDNNVFVSSMDTNIDLMQYDGFIEIVNNKFFDCTNNIKITTMPESSITEIYSNKFNNSVADSKSIILGGNTTLVTIKKNEFIGNSLVLHFNAGGFDRVLFSNNIIKCANFMYYDVVGFCRHNIFKNNTFYNCETVFKVGANATPASLKKILLEGNTYIDCLSIIDNASTTSNDALFYDINNHNLSNDIWS